MDFLLLYLFSLVFGFWVFKKLKEWQTLPPGPWGVPILGYLPFINPEQPHLTLTKLSKQYGSIYGLSMGNIYTIVLTDHKLIREAFAKDIFTGRAPLFLTHGIMHGNGIICSEGALWKDQRKLVMTWLRSFGMTKYGATRSKMEKRILARASEVVTIVENSKGSAIDMNEIISNFVGSTVNEIIFGYRFPDDDKTWKWFLSIQEEGAHEMGVAGVVNFLPFVRFLSSNIRETIRIIERGQAQTHRLYACIIDKRRKMLGLQTPEGAKYLPHQKIFEEHPKGHIKCITYSKKADNVQEHYFDPEVLIPTEDECIVDEFLMEQKRRFESGDETAVFTRDEQLLYLLADMFGAGLDTSSVTLRWFLLYMTLFPDEQELIRNEILSVSFDEAEIDVSKTPYLMAAICEVQRIRSIVPTGIPHGCLKETYIGDYRIPKGTMVVPLQWAIHMDPQVWEDPDVFRPSRFISEDGSLLKPQEFIPFQTGKRMCPGDELSRMTVSGLVTRLLRRTRLRLASPRPSAAELRGKVGLTLTPPHVTYYCDPL